MGRLVDEGDDTLEMVSGSGNSGRTSFSIFPEWFKWHLAGKRLQIKGWRMRDLLFAGLAGSQA